MELVKLVEAKQGLYIVKIKRPGSEDNQEWLLDRSLDELETIAFEMLLAIHEIEIAKG